jgi:hypothetical protein
MALRQNARAIVLIRPNYFGYNPETARDNTFMTEPSESGDHVAVFARREFDAFALALSDAGMEVAILADQAHVICPDAIFPNNWVTTYQSGLVVAHPMAVPSRRTERQAAVLDFFREQKNFSRLVDLTSHEKEGKFLEGTGSIVFDHPGRTAYACLSQRTDPSVLEELCKILDYRREVFSSHDMKGHAVYHTNVVMSIGEKFALICAESIQNKDERDRVLKSLRDTNRDVIEITLDQMEHFVGNLIQLEAKDGSKVVALSSQAFDHLTPEQIDRLSQHGKLVHSPLDTIETYGGGSARCMIAENFLIKNDTPERR